MRVKDTVIRKVPFLAQLNGLKNIKKTLGISKRIEKTYNEYEKNANEITMTDEVKKIFKKSFINFIWAQPKDAEIAFSFLTSKIIPIKEKIKIEEIGNKTPILICIVKDDLQRIEMSINYYRKMGVKNFVYVDNMSTDGTFEYLLKQPDIDLYKCETPYTTQNREAWINRIIAHYGFNHWYLCVDSDDILPEDSYANLLSSIKEEYLAMGRIQLMAEKDMLLDSSCFVENEVPWEEFLKELFLENKLPYLGYVWDKLYYRSIIEKYQLCFDEKIKLNEDRLFVLTYLFHCKGVVFNESIVYCYRQQSKGVIFSTRKNDTVTDSEMTVIRSFEKMKKICKD